MSFYVKAQQDIIIEATLLPEKNTVEIKQTVVFKNTSTLSLNEIYFNDWANSFSSKKSQLAQRFAENYESAFHFEKDKDRGKTTIFNIVNSENSSLEWHREPDVDIVKVDLNKPLLPGESISLNLIYKVQLPHQRFTRFGFNEADSYKMRYWYLSPAVLKNNSWQYYSNKNTDDLYLAPSNFTISITHPISFSVASELNVIEEKISSNTTTTTVLKGENRNHATLYIERYSNFETIETDKVSVVTNLNTDDVNPAIRALLIDRIVYFLDEKLGDYPFEKIIASQANYKNNPVYGLNQLPDFISPFPDGFEYDLEEFKTISKSYLQNSLSLHPREDHWLIGALQIYLLIDYVDTYYPEMKLLGSLSNIWLVKWAHASQLNFNDQYTFLYLNMARKNLNQPLTMPKDSLIEFNKNIASPYYGGEGLHYLSDYIGKEPLEKTIKTYFTNNTLVASTPTDFKSILSQNTEQPIDWFFDNYVGTRDLIDFKFKKIKKVNDSVDVTIKNVYNSKMPVSLYGLNKDNITFKKWIAPFDTLTTIRVPTKDIRKLALNYEGNIPEFNRRNNYRKIKGLLNRPIQFRFFKDIEDPSYNQLFFMPVFAYNIYDGFALGVKLYNKTLLAKGLNYKIEPQYAFKSKTLVGGGSVYYNQLLDSGDLYNMRYGISGKYFSYDRDLFYRRFTPFMSFSFRDNKDFRNNKKQFITLRNVNVSRDEDPLDPNPEPNYSIFNLQYTFSNPNLINHFTGNGDYQISSKFSKISTTLEYRKLFLNNQQLNLRFFAGIFIFNDTRADDDYFSFALDRPTDYMFDYNYYGRSEDSGLFSQQLIIAEGGFKSQLQPAFANQWITTLNASTNLWRWIFVYADAGLVQNKNEDVKAVYDSGIRVSLVADYFELYFPMYSNLGFEPSLPNYDQKIRFIITLSPKTLLGLFTRKWY